MLKHDERIYLGLGIGFLIAGFLIAALFIACPGRPTVDVQVCAATNLLPNQYCPEKVTRRFYKGQEPTTACTLHKAPEPPIPPAPVPDVRVWVGVYDLLCADGDWKSYLTKVKSNGATGIRFFADFAWQGPGTQPFLPAAYDEATAEKIRHKDPNDEKKVENDGGVMTLVRDSGARFPIFDYTHVNPVYGALLAEVLGECKRLGLSAWVSMLDYSTLKTSGDAKYYSPWYVGMQRLLPGITDGTWGAPMRPWIAKYYNFVISAIKASGVDYLLEDMNEGWALSWPQDFVIAWFKWSYEAMISAGVDPARIVSTVSLPEIAALAHFYSPHQIGTADQVASVYGISPARLIWSSDGWKTGDGGADAHGGRGVGIEATKALCARILAIGGYGFELLPREAYSQNNDRANLGLIGPSWAVLHALAFGN